MTAMRPKPLTLLLLTLSLTIFVMVGIYSVSAQAPPRDIYPGDPVNAADTVFVSLDSSANASCGVTAAQNIRCWGQNRYAPMWAGGYTDVAVGRNHTCGLKLNGEVECWGVNSRGYNMLTPPTDNGTQIRFKSIDSKAEHTCGIRADNDGVVCWGDDGEGQVSGTNGALTGSTLNRAYDYSNDSFAKISASDLHTCGILIPQTGDTSSNVRCWGSNGGAAGYSSVPDIYSTTIFKDISAGLSFTCGLVDGGENDGKAICWGTNSYGQIGIPVGSGPTEQFIGEPTAERFTKISAGDYHVCGIKTDAALACWGATKESGVSTAYGQTEIPAEHLESTFSDVVAAEFHTCAILDGQNGQVKGDVVCWGSEIPYDPLRPHQVPDGRIFDPDHPYPPPHRFPQISSGIFYNCGLSVARDLVCWGGSTESPGIVDGPFKTLDMGGEHVCAIKDSGHVICLGYDQNDQASGWSPSFVRESTRARAYYRSTSAIENLTTDYTFKSVSASYFHSCGILDGQTSGQNDGTAICWGQKTNGQATPPDGMTFSSLGAGWYHTCGILDGQNGQVAGKVACWGAENKDPNSDLLDPVPSPLTTDPDEEKNYGQADVPADAQSVVFASIAAGRYHTCGIRADNGQVMCWGASSQADVPPEFADESFSDIAVSWHATCGIGSDSLVKCWGSPDSRTSVEQFRIPTDYAETRFVAISMGRWHACATKENGKVICWGADADVSTPQLEIYRPHPTVSGAYTIINTRQAWVPREFRASPVNPPLPRPPGTVKILRIEPDIRGVSFRPGEPGRLDIEVYGRQDKRDDSLGDRADITFEWVAEDFDGNPGLSNGSFSESVHSSHDRIRNEIPDDRRVLYTAPTEPGRYRVRASLNIGTECLEAREDETEQDAIDRCTAIFEITVRRFNPPGPTPEPPIDPIDVPDVIVDPEGRNYEVFTPSQGGEFVEGPCSFKAPSGAVHNNEVIGVAVTVLEDDDEKLRVEDQRFMIDGIQCQIAAVDLQGSRLIEYQLRQPGEICMPLPDSFRSEAVDTLIGVIDDDDATLTRLTSRIYLASRQGELKVCGNLSELTATTTVALPGEVVAEMLPTPIPPEIADIDTGGSRLDQFNALIGLLIGMAIVMSALAAFVFRRRTSDV